MVPKHPRFSMRPSIKVPATGAITPPEDPMESGGSLEETLSSFNKEPPSPSTESENSMDEIWQQVADQCHCSLDDIEDVYACTALQEAMIALTFKDPRAYTIEHEYRLPQGIDHHKLKEAWISTAQANPILRTRMIPTSQRGCVQAVVGGSVPWQVQETDDGINCESTCPSWRPGGPLAYFFFNVTEHKLKVTIHHSICDHWSMALLLRQAAAAYRGEELSFHPFRPLVDYVQRTQDKSNAFWQLKFGDAHEATMMAFPQLPTVGHSARPTERLERSFSIQDGKSSSSTVGTKIRLAWSILQSVYTGSDDTLFGAVNAGRAVSVAGVQDLSGPALASVPVRIKLCRQNTVAEALIAVQDEWATSMEFEHVGLQNLLRLGPGPAAACHFQTLLSVEPRDGHQLPDLFSQSRSTQMTYDMYPLILRCRPSTTTMSIEASFDPAATEPSQMERIISQFIHIYEQIDTKPSLTLLDISVVSPEDLSHLRRQNISTNPPAVTSCVHTLIERRTQQQPRALALDSWDGKYSYLALDTLSSALANHLSSHHVGCGSFVPLLLGKTKWMAVAMLAVMKSGAAFVLLEPSHPLSRLRTMCEAVAAPLVLTCGLHIELAAQLGVPLLLNVDTFDLEQLRCNSSSKKSSVGPQDPVYLTFTSGSTGTPKGVIVHHEGFASSSVAHGKPYHFTPESRVLQFASPAFDSCIIEHISTLIQGGCVCIPSADDCHSRLVESMNQFSVTVACLTPSVTRIISPDSVRSLKVLVFVGEAVLASDVVRWEPFVHVGNAYGPAECSAVFSVQPNLKSNDPANIGFSTGGFGWVVHPDNHQVLMPHGCAGELFIEGPIVGKGYLSMPEQTARAFVEPPPWRLQFGSVPSGKFYKSGDLVQATGGGSFRYHGRKDTQVKLHGQRLELADIEYHLHEAFPKARQTLAEVLRSSSQNGINNHRPEALLIAFICLPSSPSNDGNHQAEFLPPTDEFREACAAAEASMSDVLPSFMIPRFFLPLSHVPLTPSGKTNRRYIQEQANKLSLEEMKAYRSVKIQPEAPSSSREEKLQEIWAKTLNRTVEEIGTTESFFRLGGDSVSAMQVAAGCRIIGLKVAVADIFRFPTIRQLTERIQDSGSVSFAPAGEDDQTEVWFELSPVQKLFFERVPNGHNKFTLEFILRLGKPLPPPEIKRAIEKIVTTHSMLRARFEQQDSHWRQIISPDVSRSLRFRQHRISSMDDRKALQKILSTSQNTLDIAEGVMIVVDVFITDSGEQFLGLMAHHLVIDLVSWRIILQDLEDILSTGRTIQPLSLSFQQWCRLQQSYAGASLDPSETLKTEIPRPSMDYWGLEATLSANTWADATRRTITVSKETTEAIIGAANGAFHTQPVEIIQAAVLYAFVQAFDNRSAPTLFSEGHGREPWDADIDISRTVGWFTTIAPLFLDVKKEDSVRRILQLTKAGRRGISTNGWAYFASRFLHPDGPKKFESHSPMEILFNYTGLFQQFERTGALLQMTSVQDDSLLPMAPDLPRMALIDVNATVMNGSLSLSFIYNQRLRHQDRLDQWISNCLQTLEELPMELQQEQRLSAIDFPLLSLASEEQLHSLLHQVSGRFDVSPSGIQNMFPCSPVQLGMWLSQLRNPQVYWSHIRWSLYPTSAQPIDITEVKQAWQQVVDRQPILRTVFTDGVTGHGHPVQVVLRTCEGNIKTLSGSELSEEDRVPALSDEFLLNPKSSNTKGRPPHQLTVAIEPDGGAYCQLTIHHILVDGITEQRLLSELHQACNGKLDAKSAGCYSRYLGYLQTRDNKVSESHWKEYLTDVHPCVFPSIGLKARGTASSSLKLLPFSMKIGKELSCFCRNNDITISSLLQVAWGIVLRAYTGNESVCFGYLNACRDIPVQDAQDISGPLINLLICRLNLSDELSVLSTLAENHSAYAQSLDHQHCALAEVMHSLDLSGQPLFNTAMSLQKDPGSLFSEQCERIKLQPEDGVDSTEYDLTINITSREETIDGDLTYWTHTVDEAQAELVADTFHHIILQLIDPSVTNLSDINLSMGKNASQMLRFNSKLPQTVRSCIHNDIQRIMTAQPTSPAVDAWDGQFSYETLDVLSSLLAKDLTRLGVGPEVFVPVCRERSRWTVVAILAILKAGGAFILLDPSHPRERLQEMIQVNFQCPVIITSSRYLELAATLAPNPIIVEDRGHISQPDISTSIIPSLASPSSSAYVVFTSGSTGRPKASVIEHQSFLSASAAHAQILHLDKHARVLQFASYAFDASIVEMIDTLLVGGCICIPSDRNRNQRLAHAIREMQVNWTLLTPSVARILNSQDASTLETLVLGGEGMTRDDVRRWSPHVCLMNAYGPSECSVIATAQPSAQQLAQDESNIGYPVGCVAWVAHPKNPEKLVPVGAVGELLIEGPIIGRGYVNRPEAMAAAFVPYPIWLCKLRGSSQGVLYRTGDLVRRLADGSVQYLGRKDRQVKLRGQRIELAEVEHHVQQCFPINEPEVFADLISPNDSKDPQLVASIVQPEDSDDTPAFETAVEQMKSHLQADVPAFLVPSAFIPVYQVPRLVNGKIDRERVRDAACHGLGVQISQGATKHLLRESREMTESERTLQDCWAEVLARPAETIGPDDNFFRLGGDSIAAMRLAATASEQGIELGVSDIFLHPKLSDLALNFSMPGSTESPSSKPKKLADSVPPFSMLPSNHREELKLQAMEQCNLPIEQMADIYPCTALQAGMVALTAERPGSYIGYHRFRLGTDTDLSLLKTAWEMVAKYNGILHTRFIQTESGFMQVLVQNSELHWISPGMKEDKRLEWNVLLGQPLVQFEVIPVLSEGSNISQQLDLVITIHHALYDSWSLPLLVHRARQAYQGQIPVPSEMTPFKEFIKYSMSQQKDALEHWRREFHELAAEPFPTLPSTSYRPQASTQTVRTIETGPVMDECVSRTTAIRFAWALVQSHYQSNDDVVFGIVSPGRTASVDGIEGMAGPTIATLPLRVKINDNATVSQALRNLQERTVQLMPFEQVGLPDIAAIGPEAKQACSFQTLLVEGRGEVEDLGTGNYHPMEPIGTSSGDAASNTYAIQLAVMLKPNMVTVAVSNDEFVIPTWQVEHMLDQFSHILQQVHHHPERPVHEIATLNEKDIQQLQAWNTGFPERLSESITDVISRHCERQPSSLAVSSSSFGLSYKELDILSTNVASLLRLHGATSEVFVPIYLDRSCWTVVAVLAVVKAGAAFVILDTSHPQERLRNMCEELNPLFILTLPEHRDKAEALFRNVVIMPQTIDPECASVPVHKTTRLGTDRALYAVFTSGSTGKPKGVVIEDGSFTTMTKQVSHIMGICPGSRMLHFSSYAFDLSIMEILGSLLAGACVCVLTESERRGRLTESLQVLRPSHAYLTPSVLRAMVPSELGSLRTLMPGGEPLRSSDIKQWLPHARIVPAYGPAECTVAFTVQSPIDLNSQGGNIGKPIAGACWVTDPRNPQRITSIGAVGELLLQGPQVGRGYLNNPEQTATSFISCPEWMRHFGFADGAKEGRVYRTGDLVRYDNDGSLLFVGRKDLQVKLRGQRFELAEVEKRLQEVWPEDVTDVVAEIVTPMGSMNSKCLVVFVASKAAEKASLVSSSAIPSLEIAAPANFAAQISSVKRQVSDILPDYMIPSAFIPLRQIPHTPSGKVDRRRLRDSAASATRVQLESLFAEAPSDKRVPTTGLERDLQHIWAQVLNIAIDEIGAEDSFFQLGGDSISALKVASRARAAGIAHSVESLFQWKTLMRVARHATIVDSTDIMDGIQTADSSLWSHSPYSLVTDHERADVFASHFPQGHSVVKENVEDIIPALPFQVFYITHASPVSMAQIFPVALDIDRLKIACRKVVAHHSILRTVFVETSGRFLQVILREVDPVLDLVQCDDPEAYVARESEQKVPASTTQGTMPVGFTLVTSPIKQCSALILRISHAQYDGASIPLLWKAITKAYHNESLPQAVQFKDVAYKRMGDLHKAEISFWRRYLQGAPSAALDPLRQIGKARISDNDIAEKGYTAMPSLPPDITMSTLVKAAFSWILFGTTSQSDIILGQVVHGRGSSFLDANTAIGPCLNHLPVRIRIEPDWTVEDFLDHVQVQQLEITAHDEASFDAIAESCTKWQPGSKMACLVHHQSEEAPEPFEMGGVRSSSGCDWASSKLAHGQLGIISVERGSQLELMITATEETMDQRSVEFLLDKLISTIQLFSKFSQCRLARMPSRIQI
ncbi:AMP-dependent synthetase/ligase [Penicillium concentricum]|uniref:AMP-dependent synthetase/ligase n=1 Tax=Penicillium concentricum TaxID=293559 RepID=A0A9W9S4T7_9EURO|nr:AMP-dependent synthetase/ligase [Penicillium concentricum]KAJ5372016.1 AMP-dependent synthetase/ligase [Penicillium concentricum]